ncbi:uncharacterized protein FIBRA_05722 [Fibroporia radiculosa]|uniref:Trafficking protein particle complex subunit n=1 Tax=Fibroporia radiculosa TaxID=599839 RepID=J4GRH8_9APHY|nr:uncharacterized protein FIBRA_05722 [Fibroporia radiculosa]CCM03585.1 predicted protein [Fibroporia radiculosa]
MAANVIELRLPVDQPPPEQVPYQLQSFISKDAWQARIRAVVRKGSRYIKPGFDMVWAIITFIATLAVPIGMYYVALHLLPGENEVEFDYWPYGWDDTGRIWKARGISIASFFAVLLLMWIPMFLWKLSGKSQVNKMLQRFEAEDRSVKPDVELPTYRISMPGIGVNAIKLNITVPSSTAPTSFQFNSQLPPYLVNGPADPTAAAYGYGQAPPVPVQGLPLYNQFDEKIPTYSGPPPGLYLSPEEKQEHCNCVYYQDWHRSKRPRVAVEGGGLLPAVSAAVYPRQEEAVIDTTSVLSNPKNTLSSASGVLVAVNDEAPRTPLPAPRPQSPPALQQPASAGLPFDEEAKLVYGVVLSLRNMVKKLSGKDEQFVNYRTSAYKLHLYETLSGYKFVMLSDPAVESLRFVLRQIYSGPFLEYVVRNPLVNMDSREHGIDNEYFRTSTDRMIKGLTFFE